MKKNSNTNTLNTSLIVIIISLAAMFYFGYEIFKPILDFINKELEAVDYIGVINDYFK